MLVILRTMLVAMLIVSAGLMSTGPAAAAPEDQLGQAANLLAEKSYESTVSAIEIIAASGAAHSADILTALSKRRVYIGDDPQKAVFKTGKAVFGFINNEAFDAVPKGAKSVRVNNRLRNVIKAAFGALQLRAAEPEARLKAAEEIFRSREKSALAALEDVSKTEANADVKKAFGEARAAILLSHGLGSQAEQLAAIEAVKLRGGRDGIALLTPVLESADASVSAAAKAAITSIENWQQVIGQAQNVWFGISLGSVLLLAAIGLAITFGVMGVINMAHGEMVMLGAYTTFVVQELFRAYAPDAFDMSLVVAVPAAFFVAGLVGIAIERGIIQFLYGRPLETLLATWGVSLFLQQTVRTIFGPTNREVGNPSFMSGGFDFFGLYINYNRLWIVLFALFVFLCLLLILKATTLGLRMRAVTQNRRMASSMGIRTGYVDAMTFGLGSGIAGIAGVALSQIDNVSPNLGQSYIVDSFMVVVFGGVGNLWGTLVSAFTLGIMTKYMEPMAGAVLAKIFILVLLILFIQKRPRGLFALKGRAVES